MEEKRNFDLLTLGQVLLRLSPPNNDRLVRGDTFVKQVGGAELNVAVGVAQHVLIHEHLTVAAISQDFAQELFLNCLPMIWEVL